MVFHLYQYNYVINKDSILFHMLNFLQYDCKSGNYLKKKEKAFLVIIIIKF